MRAYSIAMEGLSMANLMDAARSRRVQGLDFNAQDVMRAFKIYGPSLKMVRCGSVKTKRSKTAPPVREMTVGAGVTMQIDIIFAAGVPYLIGVVKLLGLLICSCNRSKATRDVRGVQRGSLTS